MFRRVLAFAALAAAIVVFAPVSSSGASKEIQELQRDVAQLQDQLRQLQQSQNQQLTEIKTLVQQSLNSAIDANKSVAIIQDGFQRSIREQENKVVAPVVGLGTRMDQMGSEMRTVQQAIGDLTGMMSKIQAQLTDVGNAVKIMQAPAPPPPGGGGPGGAASGAPQTTEAPSISARDLYDNANRDRQGGKFDLALQEFSDYLKFYGNTDLAPNAQYYIAWIHASQNQYDTAVKEYDMVLEKYPDNNKTPDALYGKGVALTKMGRRTDGAKEFQELMKRFPGSGLASQACTQLTNMGLKCNGPRAALPKGGGKRPTRK